MKTRILTGWTFTRVLYLLLGVFVMVQSVINRQWIGLAFGGYFASMGLFAFGCAAGYCGNVPQSGTSTTPSSASEVEFEEVKAERPTFN